MKQNDAFVIGFQLENEVNAIMHAYNTIQRSPTPLGDHYACPDRPTSTNSHPTNSQVPKLDFSQFGYFPTRLPRTAVYLLWGRKSMIFQYSLHEKSIFSSKKTSNRFGFFPMTQTHYPVAREPLRTLPFIYLRTVFAKNLIFGDFDGLLHSVFILSLL